ncbi:uncharacterized protein SCHCODRAFT_01125215 [Schizophyllum commune H4-8]|uniref:uncharacterized protein n=1 Tax=Schizophyllum commune (strain H4-8 / FGSC 9210) TaxID=578458 RepID=UPI00215EA6DA|nr:uncharacterized protein SCHCODRAFT_01125215 [Schizophyllum commune H4-8]KAI5892176.1 hypothetical protein SCHCODRAFT_01125215 [Schizophyllum commune H4-8]
MTSVSDIDMTPKGLVNDDGNYVLQHEDIANLLKYVWSGVLLPVTVSAYQDRLNLSTDTVDKLSDVIDPLLAAYATAQKNCLKFRDETYPSIVDLSNDVFAYAQTAGGTIDDSYYAAILNWIRELNETTDPGTQKELRQSIDAIIDQQTGEIERMQARAKGTVADLKTFESLTQTDQNALSSRSNALNDKIIAELGSIKELDAEMEKYRKQMRSDMDECEHDRVIAQTSAAYVWLFPFGTIAAAAIAVIFTNKANDMERSIRQVKDLIAKDQQKKHDETNLSLDLKAIGNDLKSVRDKIQPCIKVLETMEGVWSAIAGDLSTIKELLARDFRSAGEAMAKLEAKKLVNDWNELKVSIDKYRQVAYVADVSTVTMDEYVVQLHEASK